MVDLNSDGSPVAINDQPAAINQNWLPGLDSHQDKRLNRPPCYFDTTWQWRCRQELHLPRSV